MQLRSNLFTALFLSLICALQILPQSSSISNKAEKKEATEPAYTQPFSLVSFKNLIKSESRALEERFQLLFEGLLNRKIDFDINPQNEIDITSSLREQKFSPEQIVKLIKRLKLINAEIRFFRLEGIFLVNLESGYSIEKDSGLLEKANEIVELFLSSEKPKDVGKVYNLRGSIYFQQTNYDRAINELKKAITVGFRGRATNQLLGQCYLAKGEDVKYDLSEAKIYLRNAIRYFTDAISLDPDHEVLYRYRGLVFQKLDNKEQAEVNFKRYQELRDMKTPK